MHISKFRNLFLVRRLLCGSAFPSCGVYISVMMTENALQQIKVNKAVGPDNMPAWVLRDNASTLAAPLTALFNTSLRDGVIPALWKTAHVIPLPKKQPPRSIEKDIRPISLTPIVSKIF